MEKEKVPMTGVDKISMDSNPTTDTQSAPPEDTEWTRDGKAEIVEVYWFTAECVQDKSSVLLHGVFTDPGPLPPSLPLSPPPPQSQPTQQARRNETACVVIPRVPRISYVLPVGQVVDQCGAKTQLFDDVMHELSSTFAGMSVISARVVKKNCAFGMASGAMGCNTLIELCTDFGLPGPNTQARGKTFSSVMCTTMDPVETFLVGRGIRGPGRVAVRDPVHVGLSDPRRVSSCASELSVGCQEDVRPVADDGLPAPPVRIFELDVRCRPDGCIVAAAARGRSVFDGVTDAPRSAVDPSSSSPSDRAIEVFACGCDGEELRLSPHGKPFAAIRACASEADIVSNVARLVSDFSPSAFFGSGIGESLAVLREWCARNRVDDAVSGAFTMRMIRLDRVRGKRAYPTGGLSSKREQPPQKSRHLPGGNGRAAAASSSSKRASGEAERRSRLRDVENARFQCGFLEIDSDRLVEDYSASKTRSTGTMHVSGALLGAIPLEHLRVDWIDDSGTPSPTVRGAAVSAAVTADVMWRATESLGGIELTRMVSRIAGCPWAAVLGGRNSEMVEYMLMHEFDDSGFVLPDKQQRQATSSAAAARRESKYEGGMTMPPDVGLHVGGGIALLDFKSLYPSIIIEHNVCPSTVCWMERPGGGDARGIEPPARIGVVPELEARLVERRRAERAASTAPGADGVTRHRADIAQRALKLVSNKVYGCFGMPGCRFHDKRIASFIAERGRAALARAAAISGVHGAAVIYGVTDSLMLKYGTVESLAKIVEEINSGYRAIRMAVEMEMSAVLVASSNQYACITADDRVVYKGLACVRRNVCKAAQDACSIACEVLMRGGSNSGGDISEVAVSLEGLARELSSATPEKATALLEASVALGSGQEWQPNDAALRDKTSVPLPHVRAAVNATLRRARPLRSGESVTFVVCRCADPRWGGHSRLCEESSEVVRGGRGPDGERLLPDVGWYLSEQIGPEAVRICALAPRACLPSLGVSVESIVARALGVAAVRKQGTAAVAPSSSSSSSRPQQQRPTCDAIVELDTGIITALAGAERCTGGCSTSAAAIDFGGGSIATVFANIVGHPLHRVHVMRLAISFAPVVVSCVRCSANTNAIGLWYRSRSGAAVATSFSCSRCMRLFHEKEIAQAIGKRTGSRDAYSRVSSSMHIRSMFDAEWVSANSGVIVTYESIEVESLVERLSKMSLW